MTVNHPHIGTGTIISQDENNVTVDFNGTVKVMIIKFAKLTNEDGTPFGVHAVAAKVKTKKVNPANFMSEEEFIKSDVAKLAKDEWEARREKAKWSSISW